MSKALDDPHIVRDSDGNEKPAWVDYCVKLGPTVMARSVYVTLESGPICGVFDCDGCLCAASVLSQQQPESDWKLAEHILRDPKAPTLLKVAACQVIARAGDKAASTSSALISVETFHGEPDGGELHRAAVQAL